MKYDFFISHAWADPDDNIIIPIVKRLKEKGYSVWIDHDMWATESGRKDSFLKTGIEQSLHCVPFLSKEYFLSENSMFELKYILQKLDEHIFPFWSPSLTKEYIKNQPFGDRLIEIVGISRLGTTVDQLVEQLINLKNSAEGLRVYNGIELLAEDARVMEEIEKILGCPIPLLKEDSTKDLDFGFHHINNRIVSLILRKKNDGSAIEIGRFPDSVSKLDNLKVLSVSIENFTDSMTQLVSLIHLDVHDSKLNDLPKTIANLTNLNELDLSKSANFHLKSNFKFRSMNLPIEMKYLSSLKILDLSGNNFLTHVPIIPTLEELNLNDTRTVQIPHLSNLRILTMSNCLVTSFPQEISNLTALERLDLSNNLINSIPDSIGNLQSLMYLNISKNKLKSIPNSIGNLKALDNFWMYENYVQELPDSLNELTNLKIISVENNPLSKRSKKIIETLREKSVDISDIQAFFEKQKKKEKLHRFFYGTEKKW